MSIRRIIINGLKWGLVVTLSLFLCLLLIGYLFFPNCDGNSPKANYARSISKDRLEKLYSSIVEIKEIHESKNRQFLKKAGVDYFDLPIHISYEDSPNQIKDIEFSNIRISKNHSRIMLQGCFDHFLTMNIDGLYGEENPRLSLSWGQFEYKSEVLWEK